MVLSHEKPFSENFKKCKKSLQKLSWLSKLWRDILTFTKLLMLPPFGHFFFFTLDQTDQQPFSENLDNLKNAKMNNIDQIDFCIKDWIYDNDFALSRKAQEFPRISVGYDNLFKKPVWGDNTPTLINILEPYTTEYTPGSFHYGSIPLSDHLDSCAFGPILSPIRYALGTEFRYQMWRAAVVRCKLIEK